MRLAVISDLHLGDGECRLVGFHQGEPRLEQQVFRALCDALESPDQRPLDWLVLLGDVLDFSIARYADAYQAARVFFSALCETQLVRDYLYLPGNHDYSLWESVMHQANVVSNVAEGRRATARSVVPAVLDARPGQESALTLVGVRPCSGKPRRYGGLFLDALSGGEEDSTRPRFHIAYPNAYLIEPDRGVTLLTHGQYFQPYWTLLLDLARGVFGSSLPMGRDGAPTITDIVTIDSGLNALTSAGLGQSGALGGLIARLQDDVEQGQGAELSEYVGRLLSTVTGRIGSDLLTLLTGVLRGCLQGWVRAHVDEFAAQGLKGRTRRTLTSSEGSRLVQQYLNAASHECSVDIPRIDPEAPRPDPNELRQLIFGHTHDAILPSDTDGPSVVGWPSLRVANTGGWLANARPLVMCFDSETRPFWTARWIG